VTGDCHAPFWGSPGVTPPGHPTLTLLLTGETVPALPPPSVPTGRHYNSIYLHF
jgi:hypothetical protein